MSIKCPECKRWLRVKGDLKRHQELTHKGMAVAAQTILNKVRANTMKTKTEVSHTPQPDMRKHGIFPWTKEEQAYIVRAVNSHAALLKAAGHFKWCDFDNVQTSLEERCLECEEGEKAIAEATRK